MKYQFLKDFGEYKAGDVVELSEEEADDHLQAGGRVVLYDETAQKEPAEKPKAKAKK